jgi:hypothetical protein
MMIYFMTFDAKNKKLFVYGGLFLKKIIAFKYKLVQ